MCIRAVLTLNTVAAQQAYSFSSISVASITGASYVLVVRKAARSTTPLEGRSWDWFYNYCVMAPASGSPTRWSQLNQGNAGNFYLWPTPTGIQALTLDCVIIPIYLIDDTTVELLPYPWTDAIAYYGAYLAYMGAQRNADADRMWKEYQKFMQRARDISTPSALPRNLPISSQPSGVPSSTPTIFPGGSGGA
jgi:hypothetical protein